MLRTRRAVYEGMPHHITQRGNYRQRIFDTDNDRKQYLEWVAEYSKKYKVEILAYCLMSNHVHFIVVPAEKESLAKMFNTTHMRYSHYYNNKKKAKGHLWQGRYYSCILDEAHLKKAGRYVERNPVRAKITKKAEQWQWSSAKDNMGEGLGEIKIVGISKYLKMSGKDWKDFVMEKDGEVFVEEIRKATNMSRAMGSEGL